MQLRDPGIIIFARADRRVEVVMVGDVVTVQAIGARLKIRRCIHVAYSQRMQVRNDLACLRKSEPTIELQSVGAGWNPCHVERSRDTSQSSPSIAWSNRDSRDLMRSLPVRAAFGLPVHLAASLAARFATSLGMTKRCYIFSGTLM